jgi:hypothetical protein
VNPQNLTPWKPGQSGNPDGSSRKQRTRVLLRELFAEKLGESLPPAVQEKLALLSDGKREEAEAQIKALTYGDLIAARVALTAAIGDSLQSAKAIDQILGGEPKQIQVKLPEGTSIQIETEPERLDEVAEILDEAHAVH